MNGTAERLKLLRASVNLSQRKFVGQIYISQSLYNELEQGNREISNRIAQLIVSRFNVSKEWLVNGEGEMFRGPPPDLELERLIKIYNELDDYLKHSLLEYSNTLLNLQNRKIEPKG